MSNKSYVGIDQSFTSTGVCVIDDHNQMVFHGFLETKKSGATGCDPIIDKVHRASYISKGIIDILKNLPADSEIIIGIEGLGFGARGDATRDLGGLQFVIINTLIEEGFDKINIMAPTSLKKFATGSGKAQKVDMFESLPDDVKRSFSTYLKKNLYDVCDAYWLAMMTATR